jgi:hypothetical protein
VGHNKKGSVDGAGALEYLDLIRQCWPDLSPENPVMLIFDGCSTHIGWPFITKARAMGFVCVLRPPHTTHKTQCEDVSQFPEFQARFRNERDLHSLGLRKAKGTTGVISFTDLMKITAKAWLPASSPKFIAAGWRKTGCDPVTWDRCVEHQLREEEARRKEVKLSANAKRERATRELIESGSEEGLAVAAGTHLPVFKQYEVIPVPSGMQLLEGETFEEGFRRVQIMLKRYRDEEVAEARKTLETGRYGASKQWRRELTSDDAIALAKLSHDKKVEALGKKLEGGRRAQERLRENAINGARLEAELKAGSLKIGSRAFGMAKMKQFLTFRLGSAFRQPTGVTTEARRVELVEGVCRELGVQVPAAGQREETEADAILLCDGEGCENCQHLQCVKPQLAKVPEGSWFCAACVAPNGAPGESGAMDIDHGSDSDDDDTPLVQLGRQQ